MQICKLEALKFIYFAVKTTQVCAGYAKGGKQYCLWQPYAKTLLTHLPITLATYNSAHVLNMASYQFMHSRKETSNVCL